MIAHPPDRTKSVPLNFCSGKYFKEDNFTKQVEHIEYLFWWTTFFFKCTLYGIICTCMNLFCTNKHHQDVVLCHQLGHRSVLKNSMGDQNRGLSLAMGQSWKASMLLLDLSRYQFGIERLESSSTAFFRWQNIFHPFSFPEGYSGMHIF